MNRNSTCHGKHDGILIRAWQLGDEKSFDQLFHKYYQINLRYAQAIVNHRMLAEEIAMDVMMAIWRRKEHISAEVSLLPLMLKSVKNKAIDIARRKKLPVTTLKESVCAGSGFSECNVDDWISGKEMDRLYEQSQSILTPKRRMVFSMSRDLGLTYVEIARKMRISKNTVENHLVFALKDIRRHLKSSPLQPLVRDNNRRFDK